MWLLGADVVRGRGDGDGGQEVPPGNKDVSTIGRGRGSGRWITIDTGSRHLHTFRAQLVYTPAVLRRARGFCTPPPAREEAEELAALLERLAAAYRDSHYRTSHPTPCLCHTCLVTPE
nr:hypothetical protein [Streptomyces californicus]